MGYNVNNLKPFRSGGMADLETGTLANGRTVVRRVLQQRFRFNWRVRSRFCNGTAIRTKLRRHANLVWSYESGGIFTPYEIIDYVDGPNLQELMHENPTYIRLHAIPLLVQVAEAIRHMHECGYIHLDIKAGNLIIDMTGREPVARLTDFDLALKIRKNMKASREHRVGTFNYMPPEQLSDGRIGRESDIFAFGVLAYNMFAGRMPFTAGTAAESRMKKMDDTFCVTPLKQINGDVPVRLSDLIDSCLARDPLLRPSKMHPVIKELATVAALQTISHITSTQVAPAVG